MLKNMEQYKVAEHIPRGFSPAWLVAINVTSHAIKQRYCTARSVQHQGFNADSGGESSF